MKLSVKGLAWTGAIFWGGAVLLVGFGNIGIPGYGEAFLEVARSIYPGYGATTGLWSVVVGTLYAALDGAIGGVVFAWLYNRFAGGPVAAP